MAHEIERKFLVRRGAWAPDPARGVEIRQGYLSDDPARVVRVRIHGRLAFLTVKGQTRGIERLEFEYPVPLQDAQQMLGLCIRPLVEKVRYRIPFGGHVWEVDEFNGDNEGLILAEVELKHPGEQFELPPFIGLEVSDDPRYFNSNLSRHPYKEWPT